MEPQKKVKYIQKQLFESKQERPSLEEKQEARLQLAEEKPKKARYAEKCEEGKTTVINVKA